MTNEELDDIIFGTQDANDILHGFSKRAEKEAQTKKDLKAAKKELKKQISSTEKDIEYLQKNAEQPFYQTDTQKERLDEAREKLRILQSLDLSDESALERSIRNAVDVDGMLGKKEEQTAEFEYLDEPRPTRDAPTTELRKKELAIIKGTEPKKPSLFDKSSATTRPEITKLMRALNINLDVQLTRNDTANLLATLLTCNATQLNQLYANPKLPISIKIVIKRILDDSKVGNTDFIETLWTKVFGKEGLALEQAQQAQTQIQGLNGIIPNVPVSREAYVILRETIMGDIK